VKPENPEGSETLFNRRQFIGGLAAAAVMNGLPGPLLASQRLPVRPIPGSGDSLPIVGFGNSQAFRESNREVSADLIGTLIEFGGSYIDAGLPPSRETVGQIMRTAGWHDELFLGSYVSSLEPDGLRKEISAYQKIDGSDEPMDLILSANLEEYGRNADAFRRIKDEGLARFVGVARHRQSYHEEMMGLMQAGAVDFVQVNYSMLEPEAEERLLPMAQDLGIAILINRPFVNGQYFPLVRDKPLPEWAAEFDCHSWAQFSLKFILSNPAVTCVLTETAKVRHARDNLGGGLGRLPDAATRQKMRELILSFT
jgi:diketogulonate reductase-like aldo/keto reductase